MIDLVDRQNNRSFSRQEPKHGLVLSVETSCLNDKHNDIDIGQGLRDATVHRPVQGIGMPRLKTGRVDENKLCIRQGQNTRDAVAGRLRLARHNTDLLADNPVQ